MERDSFVFYKSFYEATLDLEDTDRCACLDALFRYALYGEEPSEKGIASAMLKSFKPVIDANNQRYENGKRGGRPKNQDETKQKPNNNQTITKQKPNNNQTETKAEPNVTKPEPYVDVYEDVSVDADVSGDVEADVDVETYCPDLFADVEAVILNDGSEWQPKVELFDEYQRLYPAVNIADEFRKMRSWCLKNPTKRKTKRGISRFVGSWLERAQNNSTQTPEQGARSSPYMDAIKNRVDIVDSWV